MFGKGQLPSRPLPPLTEYELSSQFAFYKAEAGRGALDAPSLTSGVATVKQAIKSSFLGADFSGIQAQYVVVGTFAASPSE